MLASTRERTPLVLELPLPSMGMRPQIFFDPAGQPADARTLPLDTLLGTAADSRPEAFADPRMPTPRAPGHAATVFLKVLGGARSRHNSSEEVRHALD